MNCRLGRGIAPERMQASDDKKPLSIFEFPLQTWEEFCVIKLLADLAVAGERREHLAREPRDHRHLPGRRGLRRPRRVVRRPVLVDVVEAGRAHDGAWRDRYLEAGAIRE